MIATWSTTFAARAPASTGVSAARTPAIIDAALDGYYGTRDDGFWRTPEGWPGNRARRAGIATS